MTHSQMVENIRKRPGMYVGDPSSLGVENLIGYLLDAGLDQVLSGDACRVSVSLQGREVAVNDDGGGLPFFNPELAGPATSLLELAIQECLSASVHWESFRGRVFPSSPLVMTATLSSHCLVKFHHAGFLWEQSFAQGHTISPLKEIASEGKGTTFTFTPDPEIFGNAIPRAEMLRRRLFDVAHLFPGVTTSLNQETFHAANGLADYARFLAARPGSAAHHGGGERCLHMRSQHHSVHVDAVVYGTATDCEWHSWCNGNITTLHGTHVHGLKDALRSLRWKPKVALVHVTLDHPSYGGSTKDRLVTPIVRRAVRQAVLASARLDAEA